MRPGPAISTPPCCPSLSAHSDTSIPTVLSSAPFIAYWTGQAGDAAAARDQLAALLSVRERVLGPDHPDTLIARKNLNDWAKQAGKGL